MGGKGEQYAGHFPNEVATRLERFRDEYDLTTSQALVRTADRGLSAYGYENGNGDKRTRLQRGASEAAKACIASAATVAFLALFQSFAFALFISPLLLLAALFMTVAYIEPDISLKLGWD